MTAAWVPTRAAPQLDSSETYALWGKEAGLSLGKKGTPELELDVVCKGNEFSAQEKVFMVTRVCLKCEQLLKGR